MRSVHRQRTVQTQARRTLCRAATARSPALSRRLQPPMIGLTHLPLTELGGHRLNITDMEVQKCVGSGIVSVLR